LEPYESLDSGYVLMADIANQANSFAEMKKKEGTVIG
jgi:hypothetical protein